MDEKDITISALTESNDMLQEEVTRLRESNAMLRKVHRVLRQTLNSLHEQVENAKFNDEVFKSFCEGEFDAYVVGAMEGGLPENADGGTTQSTV